MAGDLPPSSSVTGVRFSAAAFITSRPTAVEPVKQQMIKRQVRRQHRQFAVAPDHG